MSEIGSERSKSWNIYTTPDQRPSSQTGIGQEAPWKNFGSSMNAISFGFVATAILISMFLVMAIFEHLFRPTSPFSSSDEVTNNSSESSPAEKFASPNTVNFESSCLSLHYKFLGLWGLFTILLFNIIISLVISSSLETSVSVAEALNYFISL